MFNEELNKVSLAAKGKFKLLKENKIGYFTNYRVIL